MKIATYNANSIRSRMGIILKWLQEHNPDVLCVQETKVTDDLFPRIEFESAGYKCAFKGQKSYNGVAILSRHDMEQVQFGLGDGEPADDTRLLKAQIQGINVVTTYVPQGYLAGDPKFAFKLAWFKRLRHWFESNFKPTDPVVWTGDLNVALEDIDVHDPQRLRNHVCFHPDAKAALQSVIQWGFIDLLRVYHPEAGQYTFWDYRYPKWIKKDVGWRLDYILATKSLVKKCLSCEIDRGPRLEASPSDHTFVVAEFK
ncbi:MAG: exodeoxyribonuclease III [Planctomycetes bacterium GWF2_50_10]|nr:MAG: exodeoxyribonuclease III [Planctomycetes bacterium GWF2_50_10]